MYRFIFTCGDVNGIGPEVAIKALERVSANSKDKFIFICPGNIFTSLHESLNLSFQVKIIRNKKELFNSDEKNILFSLPDVRIKKGTPTSASGKISYTALLTAKEIISQYDDAALITAPISKEALKMGGVNYPGHTEMLASWYKEKNYCMMFLSNKFKCGLVTIHEPIKNVSRLITKKRLASIISTINNSLKMDFDIKEPVIALLGLNPHAGEQGNIGTEEKEVITPLIKNMNHILLDGPFVPDAFFGNRLYKNYDCLIGMYHDQLLIPFKLLSFDKGVNFTAGLPIVRTSPDHGTAFDIAGKYIANPESMIEAYKWARKILVKRKRRN